MHGSELLQVVLVSARAGERELLFLSSTLNEVSLYKSTYIDSYLEYSSFLPEFCYCILIVRSFLD